MLQSKNIQKLTYFLSYWLSVPFDLISKDCFTYQFFKIYFNFIVSLKINLKKIF